MQGTAAISDDEDYQIKKSLRFDSVDSTYLQSPTINRHGNKMVWTWSGWVKRNKLGTAQSIMSCGEGADGHDRDGILFTADDELIVYWRAGGTTVESIETKQVFRDPSAWYHIVWRFNRYRPGIMSHVKSRIYVNGIPIMDNNWQQSIDSTPSTEKVNGDHQYFVYGANAALGDDSDLQLADVQFIDGLELTAGSFGKFNESGIWVPDGSRPKMFTPNTDAGSPNWNDDTTCTISDGPYSGYPSSNIWDPAEPEGYLGNSVVDSWIQVVFDNPVTVHNELELEAMLAQYPGQANLYTKTWYSINDAPEILWPYGHGTYDGNQNTMPQLVIDPDGKPWTGELTKLKIRQTTTNSSNCQINLRGVWVDGVKLTNNTTDQKYEDWEAVNSPGRIWSRAINHAGSNYSGYDLKNAFKGFPHTYYNGYTWMAVDNGWAYWRPKGGITATSSIKVYVTRHGDLSGITTWVKLNGVDVTSTFTSAVASTKRGWVTLPTTGGAHTVDATDGFGIYRRGSDGHCFRVHAIMVDGGILTDGNINNHHLKFEDETSSATLGLTQTETKVSASDGALPVFNTSGDQGGTKESGYRTDSKAAHLVLACPFYDNLTDHTGITNRTTSAITLTNTNTVNSDAQSRFYGKSAYFNNSSRIQTSLANNVLTGSWTVECWFYWLPANYNSSNSQSLIGHWGNSNGTYGWNLSTGGSDNSDIYFNFRKSGESDGTVYNMGAVPISWNKWHHVAVTGDYTQSSSTGTYQMFLDGELIGSMTFADQIHPTAANGIYIGDRGDDAGKWNGYIQDMRVYSNSSSADGESGAAVKYTSNFTPAARGDFEVNNVSVEDLVLPADADAKPIYTTTDTWAHTKASPTAYLTDANAANLVLAMPGDILTDVHHTIKGSGSAKTVSNDGVHVSTDKFKYYGSSLRFTDSETDDFSITGSADVSMGTGDFCIEFWVYNMVNKNWNAYISTRSTSSSEDGFVIASDSSGDWYVHSGDAVAGAYAGNAVVPLNTWCHVAYTRESGRHRLFVNGVSGPETTLVRDYTNDDLYIGTNHFGGEHLNAYLQDIRIYKGVAKYTSNFTVARDGSALDVYNDSPTSFGVDTGAGGEVRSNYCTLNPLDQLGDAISKGNLYLGTHSGHRGARGTFGLTSGKWYWEYTTTTSGTSYHGVGTRFAVVNHDHGSLSDFKDYWLLHSTTTAKKLMRPGAEDSSYLTSTGAPVGEIIQVMLDMDNYKVKFGNNNTWGAEVDLASTIGSSVGSYKEIFPIAKKLSWEGYVNFGQRPFVYTAPAGYKTICAVNLDDTFSGAELNNPSKYFDILTYTGTGTTSQDVLGLGFQPDLVWIKNRGAVGTHNVFDAVRGNTKRIFPDLDQAENTNANIFDFKATGIEVTEDAGVTADTNDEDATYVAWAWDAGTAAVTPSSSYNITPTGQWINATAGFSITGYTGNGSDDQTVPHGLNAVPNFVIIKNRDLNGGSWQVKHSDLTAGKILTLHLNYAEGDSSYGEIKDLDSNVTVTLDDTGNNATNVNNNGDKYIMYAWTAIPGYSAFGKYSANNDANGNFIYLGFEPHWLMIKRTNAANNWIIKNTTSYSINPQERTILADTNAAETDYDIKIDFLSNGFKLRSTDNNVNTSGSEHVYAAFARHPFKTARAR